MNTRGEGYEKLWLWFGLSRASFAVMPRILMHEMPDEWQGKMADLLNEYEATFNAHELPSCKVLAVEECGRQKFRKWPDWLLQYRRPDLTEVEALRAKPCPDCGKLWAPDCHCVKAAMRDAQAI